MITLTADRSLELSHYYNLTLVFRGYPSKLELEGLYAGSYWELTDDEINPVQDLEEKSMETTLLPPSGVRISI